MIVSYFFGKSCLYALIKLILIKKRRVIKLYGERPW